MKERKTTAASRRRGVELKEAVYQATVELLETGGYEAVTFQKVAKKAQTTRSVIYRHWDDIFDLIFEAARFHVEKSQDWQGSIIDLTFNSGELRQDLLDMMTIMRKNSELYPKNFLPFVFFEQSQGRNFFDHRLNFITSNNLIIMERILAHAQERGEAREKIGQTAKLLPFQMLRYHIMLEGDRKSVV